ncbi:MAG: ABC transporter ATP-binding protein [Candidatus Omnitrophica bacterium]|nr:ABC transporter ATP-binding protein [Candidatus Omnitrophota bacterium]
MREYLRLLKFIRPHTKLFIYAFIAMVFCCLFDGASLSMIVPLADKVLTNKQIIIPTKLPPFLENFVSLVNSTPSLDLLKFMAIFVLVMFIFKGLSEFVKGYVMTCISQKIERNIRIKLYKKLQDLSLDYYQKKRGGELISRVITDVGRIGNAVSYGITDLVYEGLRVIMFIFIIFFIHPRLAAISFVLLPLISFPILRVGKIIKKISLRMQEKMADLHSLLYETIFGARIVKAFCMEDYEVRKFAGQNQDYLRLVMKSVKRQLLLGVGTEYIGVIAGIFVFVWGGRDVINGQLSFGVFGLFLGALLSLVRPFKKLSQVHTLNQQATASSARIYEVLNTQSTIIESPNPKVLKGVEQDIVFENVSFAYEKAMVLSDINLKVASGSSIAIVGPSGVGKSTLVDLLLRFYEPQKGKILIDGVDIREFSLRSLRDNIGIVSQETILFNDAVRANISYGDARVSFEKIVEAAKAAFAHQFIMKLPQGYDTMIGERGLSLSGGERQRIAIARALLKNPALLLFDEATSQLDSVSERIVQETLERLKTGRTVFIIAHRLSTVKNIGQIIVLHKGRIVESGTHTELLRKKGVYFWLYQTQGAT